MSLNELVAKWRRLSSGRIDSQSASYRICADELESALQQQGEAVAWMTEWTDEGETVRVTFEYKRGAESRRDEVGGDARVVPLFTHPPKPVVSDALFTRALHGWAEHQRRCRITTIEGSLRAALEAALGVKS